MVHASRGLRVTRRMHTLHLCHDLTGSTLLTSFYIEPEFEATVAPELLSRARRLLLQSGQSILQVGLSCGFSSGPHFSNAYKARFGRTPRDERAPGATLAATSATSATSDLATSATSATLATLATDLPAVDSPPPTAPVPSPGENPSCPHDRGEGA